MRGDDELDAKIDAALRSYAEPESIPEPRVITARLLAEVRAQRMRTRRILVAWLPIAGGALAVLTLALLWLLRPLEVPRIAFAPQTPPTVAPAVLAPAAAAPGRERTTARMIRADAHRPQGSRPEPLPKLQVFPTPQPLSTQEFKLAAIGAGAAPIARQQVLAAEQHLDDPIRIAALKIRPLEEDGIPDQTTGKDLP